MKVKEDRWISVNERQPQEVNQKYLCTTKFGDIGVYTYTQFENETCAWMNGSYYVDVIAWQHLPESYKPIKMELYTKQIPRQFMTINGIEMFASDVCDAVEKFEEDSEWHYSYFEYNSSIDKLVDAGVIKTKYGERQATIYAKNEYTDDFIKQVKALKLDEGDDD